MKKSNNSNLTFRFFEPFVELLNPKLSLTTKKNRFLGRFKFYRNLGYITPKVQNLVSKDKLIHNDKSSMNHLNSLELNSYSDKISLTQSTYNQIVSFIKKTKCISFFNDKKSWFIDPIYPINPDIYSIYRIIDPHKNNSLFSEIANEESIKDVVNMFLGKKPDIFNSQIWFSFPDTSNNNPDFRFHYDLYGKKFIKLFFYLDDVKAENGPHQILTGSHNADQIYRFFNRRLPDLSLIEKKYILHSFELPKAHGFFEDTYAYHRGSKVKKHRIILQFTWGLN